MTETYATRVVRVLREHFPDLADPDIAEVAAHSIEEQECRPRASFEFIVDDPFSANWRLKAKPGRDSRHVRLRCYRVNRRQSDDDLEDAVNGALQALETSAPRAGEKE
jgi:hypothetical protein